MISLAAAVLLGVTLASSPEGGITCETRQVPRQISRNVQTLDTVTYCYPAAKGAAQTQLDRLQSACDLLITAYGSKGGRERCQELIRRVGERGEP